MVEEQTSEQVEVRKHVTRVSGNVKGEFSHELTPCTLIVGKNASGKSRVIDALALALTGQARTDGLGKREVDLMALAPRDAGELLAETLMSDGEVSRWRCKGSTAKAQRAEWTGVGATMICDEAYALLHASPKKLRESLLRRIGGSITQADLKHYIPEALWGLWAVELSEVSASTDTWSIDEVMQAGEHLDSKLRAARAQVKVLQTTIDAGSPDPLSDTEIASLSALVAASSRAGMSEEQISSLKDRREALAQAYANAQSEYVQLSNQVTEGANAADEQLMRQVFELQSVVAGMVEGHEEFYCPVCSSEVKQSVFAARVEEARSAVERLSNASQAVSQHNRAVQLAASQEATLKAQLADVERQIAQATLKEPVDIALLGHLRDREAAVEKYLASKTALGSVESEERNLVALKGLVGDIIGGVLDKKVVAFSKSVTAALPSGMSCEVALRDGTRQICRVALKASKNAEARDFRALSGAERAILVSAFAVAVSTGESARIVVIDDVWFDPDTQKGLMKSLAKSVQMTGGPSQVIMSAVSWHGRTKLPEGWSMIRVDGSVDVGEKGKE